MKPCLPVLAALLLCAAGCATYTWTSTVPQEKRCIAVPMFENDSGTPEIDALLTQYTLREFQREGTFKIGRLGKAPLKLIGRVTHTDLKSIVFDRNFGSRTAEYEYTLVAEITLVEVSTGKLLIDGQKVKAKTTFLTRGDMLTGMQDAGPRISKELARSIVDAVLAYW